MKAPSKNLCRSTDIVNAIVVSTYLGLLFTLNTETSALINTLLKIGSDANFLSTEESRQAM